MNEQVIKPSDWIQSNKEARLENAYNAINNFIKNPTLENKEFLLSMLIHNDLNETSSFGLFRITKYEISMLNSIYMQSKLLQCPAGFLFVYEYLIELIILIKSQVMCLGAKYEDFVNSEEILGLHPVLKVFFTSYLYFRIEKKKSFCDQLCLTIKTFKKTGMDVEVIRQYIEAANALVYDLSWNINSNKLEILCFNKEEIEKLYTCLINLWNEYNLNACERPLRGVFILSLTNFVLKARVSKNRYFYKCIDDNACNASFANRQIWFRQISMLNDKREGKFFKEIFLNKQWIDYSWARNIGLDENIERYVCSFCKVKPSDDMEKLYGKNIYGYKNDRICFSIAPYYLINKIPQFGTVICYDVCYDKKIIQDEFNFVSKIINLLETSDDNKKEIMTRFLSYWYYTIKDSKWASEKERRYEIRFFEYPYVNTKIEEGFLKTESTLLLLPDFVNKENIMHDRIKIERINKLKTLAMNEYIFCEDCLQNDYDSIYDDDGKCKVCGSTKIHKIKSAYYKN